MSNDTNDQTEKLACMKRLRDVLNEAIAALETGRDADVEYRYPKHHWHRYVWLGSVEQRCRIKPREVWINEYPYRTMAIHNSPEEAESCATPDRIRCTRFVEAPPEDNQ